MKVKTLVTNLIKLIFVETFYGLIISTISLGKKILLTVVSNGAGTAEISRLNGETSLAISETLANYNNTLQLAANAFIIVFVILMLYSLYKFIEKTFFKKEI